MEFGAKIAQKVKKINQQKEGRILRDSEGEEGGEGEGVFITLLSSSTDWLEAQQLFCGDLIWEAENEFSLLPGSVVRLKKLFQCFFFLFFFPDTKYFFFFSDLSAACLCLYLSLHRLHSLSFEMEMCHFMNKLELKPFIL